MMRILADPDPQHCADTGTVHVISTLTRSQWKRVGPLGYKINEAPPLLFYKENRLIWSTLTGSKYDLLKITNPVFKKVSIVPVI
jgi:hypothetical protein